MNKRLILSVATFCIALTAIGGATLAYFSDTETGTGNLITTGTIDIAVTGDNPWEMVYATDGLNDLKPGGHEVTMTFEVENVGLNPANIWKRLTNLDYTDGVRSEPEGDAGGLINDFGPYLNYTMDVDGNPLIEEGWNITVGDIEEVWIPLKTLQPQETMTVTQTYQLDASAGNEFQGDQLMFDVELYAEQMMGPGPVADANVTALVLENKDTEHWLPVIGDGKWALLSWDGTNYNLRAWGVDDTLTYRVAYWNESTQTENGVSGYESPTSGTLDFDGVYDFSSNPVGKYWLRPMNWDNTQTLWESNPI